MRNGYQAYILSLERYIVELCRNKNYDRRTIAELLRTMRYVNARGIMDELVPVEEIVGDD